MPLAFARTCTGSLPVMLKPRPYQEEAADFLFEHDRAMILAPVGAGKTMITLTAMHAMVKDGVARRWLVLAPKRVCTDVWPVEAAKWAPGLKVAVAVGTPAQRVAALGSDADVVVANYDTIQSLPALDRFDGVVIDELTRLKNPSGARFKALFKKLEAIPIRWGLTGSFTSNGLEDVFGQCKVIDETLLGRSKGAFLQTWFIPISREFGQWVARPSALVGIMNKIKPATFVLEPGEYADTLPPLHVVEVRSTMDMKAYDKMKRDYVAQVGTETVTALTAAAMTQKLQMLAGGWVYSPAPVWFSSHRFDRLDEVLEGNQRANTLVVYNFREELAELKRRYPTAQTLDDDDAITRWNAGQIPLLLVNPRSAGHGLNLQHGGSKIVFVSLPWSLELFEQTVGRLHRSGQKHPVWAYVMISEKTIDERIWASLHDKRSLSQLATEELAA